MASPDWGPGARNRSCSDKDHSERGALNDVVERVVIEVDRMNAYVKLLHSSRGKSEREACNSPAYRWIVSASIRRQQHEEQKESARQVRDDSDVELAGNE
jgi:hypothetical protein